MNIMRDTGFIKYLHDNMTKINKCTAERSNPDRRKVPKLTSADLVGVFVLWLCGTAVSTVVFAFEILVSIASKFSAVCKMRYFPFDKMKINHSTFLCSTGRKNKCFF